jgi:uncharacterized membrane protein
MAHLPGGVGRHFVGTRPACAGDAVRPNCRWTRVLSVGTLFSGRHWLALVNLAWGLVFGLPWLAPMLMRVGATRAARVIYFAYGFLCHQFADRSFFLFGPRLSYMASELLPLAPAGDPRLAIRAFQGIPALGYKVAWSDRMVAIYGGVLVGGLLFALARHRLQGPRWWGPALLLLSMAIDGATHVLSDLAGFNVGFRYTNVWLVALTGHRLGKAFYVGNALGSFNSWARLISGALAGLTVVWAAYPAIERTFGGDATTLVDLPEPEPKGGSECQL